MSKKDKTVTLIGDFEIRCANDFQKETVKKLLDALLETLKGRFEAQHKKNEFNYFIIEEGVG